MGKGIDRPSETESAGTTATTESTSTASTGKRGRGRPPGSTNKTKPSGEIPRLVAVEVPGDKKEDEKKAETKPPAKKKSARKPAKKKADTTQLKMLVSTISALVAARPGMEVWNLSPEEIDQVIEPLGNIMARHDVGAAASEYADYIALIMALFIIFIPKYLIWKASRPPKNKKEKVKKNVTRTEQPKQNGSSTGSSTEHAPGNAVNGTTFGGELHGLISPIGGI